MNKLSKERENHLRKYLHNVASKDSNWIVDDENTFSTKEINKLLKYKRNLYFDEWQIMLKQCLSRIAGS